MELAATLLNSRVWSTHGLKIVWGVCALSFFAVLTTIAYSVHSNQKAKESDYAPQNLPPLVNTKAPQYRVSDITSANLFGDPRPKEVITKEIPKTNLNLKLIGVLWASDQNMARVIIQSGNKKANLYAIGENIEGASASVKEIQVNEILISRNGATEKLPLLKKKSSDSIISFESVGYLDQQVPLPPPEDLSRQENMNNIGRSNSRKPISANGKNRKIRKPNFSGLDRALQKMGEI